MSQRLHGADGFGFKKKLHVGAEQQRAQCKFSS
jgi:hypothetical protein